MSNDRFWVEFWWWVVNVFAVVAAPWIFNSLFVLAVRRSAPSVKWDKWVAYRDGQLGFVAMGWAAAALYDISTHASLYPHPGLTQFFLVACILGGGLFAATGARQPVDSTNYQPAGPTARWWKDSGFGQTSTSRVR